MIPVMLSQFAAEAFMYLMHIDLNVNSLPIAAVGAGVGVDYGIYHFSRMIDACRRGPRPRRGRRLRHRHHRQGDHLHRHHDDRGTIFWWFSDLKFQAEMGLLLALLMVFNTFGGLVLVPAWMKVIRPRFLTKRGAGTSSSEPAQLAVG